METTPYVKKQPRLKPLILALVALCFLLAWFFRPTPKFQSERIDSEFPKIGEPLQAARVLWCLDGGSISVELIRTNGQITTCFLQVSDEGKRKWEKIYIGTNLNGKEMGRELPFPSGHRNYLIAQIESFAPKDEMKISTLVNLRGYSRDFVSARLFSRGL